MAKSPVRCENPVPSAFTTKSRTSRILNKELESWIRESFSITKGYLHACRWQNKNGDYAEWRVETYWFKQGVLHHKTLGKLAEVMARLHAAFDID